MRPDAPSSEMALRIRIACPTPKLQGDGLVFIAGNLAAAVQGDAPWQAVQQGRPGRSRPAWLL